MTQRVPLWGVAVVALVAGVVAFAQGYQPGVIQDLDGPVTITGNATITGTLTATGAISAGSANFITTGKYCTTANCSSNYISNDTFGTTTFTGAASFSNNVSIIGFISAGDYAKLDATAVSGGNACSAGNEGKIRRDSAGGGTTGHRTKICLCTSDGAGTPAYAWQNIISGTVGTTTACND